MSTVVIKQNSLQNFKVGSATTSGVNSVKLGSSNPSTSVRVAQQNTNTTQVLSGTILGGSQPKPPSFSEIVNDGGVNIAFNPVDNKYHVTAVTSGDQYLDGGEF
jgi:hypothetical protein